MKLLLSAIAALISIALYSQEHTCNTKIFNVLENAAMETVVAIPSLSTSTTGECNKIRVVVHVIYNSLLSPLEGSGEISEAQVKSQIRITNQFFRNDSMMFHEENNPLGIELILADTDPQGNPTTGILYHDGVELFGEAWAEYGIQNNNENAVHENVVANQLSWGTDINGVKYINSYVVSKIDGSSGMGVQGYAYLPTVSSVYGNYNLYNAFGSSQLEDEYDETFTLKYYTDLGQTWTHEVLHNFGLLHTFNGNSCGPEMNGLIQGDKVADTPPQTQGFGCSGSCGFVSYNVMDYLNESCKNRISPGQVERVNNVILASLSQYLVCGVEYCNKSPDFNGDGTVNIMDISQFSQAFGCSNFESCFGEVFDLNCDETINIQDASLMQSSF